MATFAYQRVSTDQQAVGNQRHGIPAKGIPV